MEKNFLFQITAMDREALLPQVSYALEKRTELDSRKKYPKLWKIADRLNGVEKVPEEARKKRRKTTGFLSLIDWMLAVFALIPALVEPKELLLLLVVGTACLGIGIIGLWKTKRKLLGVLSLLLSSVLCIGVLGNWEELGNLLILGIVHGVIGIAAFIPFKREKENPFERAAGQLLEMWEHIPEEAHYQAEFSPTAMTFFQKGHAEKVEVPYHRFEFVIETKDIWLITFEGTVTALQKKDLTTGTVEELTAFLLERTTYVKAPVTAGVEEP